MAASPVHIEQDRLFSQPAQAVAVLNTRIDTFACLMGSLQWDDLDPYYGTVLLVKITKPFYYFLTPAHEIPKDSGKWKDIRVTGCVTDHQAKSAKVVGIDRGQDVALLAVERAVTEADDIMLFNVALETSIERQIGEKKWRTAILGIPSYSSIDVQMLKTATWKEEAETMKSWAPQPELSIPWEGLPSPAEPLPLRQDCPPVFSHGCYQVSHRSWGFSGGLLLVAPESIWEPENAVAKVLPLLGLVGNAALKVGLYPRIAGIVTHFSPLGETTYVLPIVTALDTALRLLKKSHHLQNSNADVYYEDQDATGTFRMVCDEKSGQRIDIEILKGPLAGKWLSGAKSSQAIAMAKPGGGESSGGGGESSGGGGESFGGGGESSGGGADQSGDSLGSYFLLGRDGNVVGLANFEQTVSQLKAPGQWGSSRNLIGTLLGLSPQFKGVDALLKFRPGIVLSSNGTADKSQTIYGHGDRSIVNLPSFVTSYLANPDGKLFEQRDTVLPEQFQLPASKGYGLFTGLTVYQLKKLIKPEDNNEASLKVLKESKIRISELLMLLAQLRDQGKLHGHPVDVVAARIDYLNGGSVSRASLIRSQGEVQLKAFVPRLGELSLSFSDEFEAQGDTYFRFTGPLTIRRSSENAAAITGFGVAIIQKLPVDRRWEIKIVYGHQGEVFSKLKVPGRVRPCEDESKQLNLEALSLPLEETKQAISIAMTREERHYIDTAVLPTFDQSLDFIPGVKAVGTNANEQLEAFTLSLDALNKKIQVAEIAQYVRKTQANIQEADRKMREMEAKLGITAPPLGHVSLEQQTHDLEARLKVVSEIAERLEKQRAVANPQ